MIAPFLEVVHYSPQKDVIEYDLTLSLTHQENVGMGGMRVHGSDPSQGPGHIFAHLSGYPPVICRIYDDLTCTSILSLILSDILMKASCKVAFRTIPTDITAGQVPFLSSSVKSVHR